MRSKFIWYFGATKEELDDIWKNGVLTVDTNVLLDLYRYHQGTRDSLLSSLKGFEGSKWLSHQAATEFFRNRTKVIVSSEKAFKQAVDELEKMKIAVESSVSQLKGSRIIPAEIARDLDDAVRPLISKARGDITTAKDNYPNFLQNDPILDQLSELFADAIGDDFKEDEREGVRVEAEDRKNKKVPPGYADEAKDEDRPYGDYYLWRQILNYASSVKRPIVLVTSERKEDWWERISGKTTGPRPELLKEAREVSGQRILIYQTEFFLEQALERSRQPVNEKAIEEIRAVGTWRTELEAAIRLIEQVSLENSQLSNCGSLQVELRRPVKSFTVSGHLDPHMESVPELRAWLLNGPETLHKHKITARTGTTHDFNVHLNSIDPAVRLPVGLYVFGYEAKCEDSFPVVPGVSDADI